MYGPPRSNWNLCQLWKDNCLIFIDEEGEAEVEKQKEKKMGNYFSLNFECIYGIHIQ